MVADTGPLCDCRSLFKNYLINFMFLKGINMGFSLNREEINMLYG